MKALIVTNIPNPYRIPLFNELHDRLSEKNVQLKISFGGKTYSRRKFILNETEMKFDFEILSSRSFHFGNNEKTFFTYTGLMKLIKQYQPDVIVTNGFSIATTKIWLLSFFKKINYVIWTGSVRKEGLNDSWLRKMQRRLLMSKCSGYVVYGSKAKEYLLEEGINESKIFTAINTVDTAFFREETFKEKLKLSPCEKKHLTFIGYLVPRKKVIKLLEVVRQLTLVRNDFVIDIIGDGEDRVNLENFVNKNSLNPYVVFHGFRQKNELPLFLAKSCCFLFQTDFDVWGLVLNEAMAAGLPCIASPNASASSDLVKENETGFIVNYDQTEKAIEKISFLLDNPIEAKHMGNNAAAFIIENASLKKSAEGFVNAILNR